MDFSSISSVARDGASMLATFGVSLGALAVAAVMVWLCIRAKSAHPLLDRLWAKALGMKKISDPAVRSFKDEQEIFMWFRGVTATYPRTLVNAKALIAWCKAQNVDISEVRACGWHFDANRPGPRKPPGVIFILVFVFLASMSLVGGTVSTLAATSSSALMHSRDSSRWFWMTHTNAAPVFTNGRQGLQVADCASDNSKLATTTGFSVSEVDALCKFLSKDDSHQYIEKTVVQQRVVFGFLALMVLWFSRWTFQEGRMAASARKLQKHLASDQKWPLSPEPGSDPGKPSSSS